MMQWWNEKWEVSLVETTSSHYMYGLLIIVGNLKLKNKPEDKIIETTFI